MQTYWTKFRGGKFQLEYAAKLIDDGKQIKLEVNNLSDNIKRIYDIEVTTFDNPIARICNPSAKIKAKYKT